jgi:FimV-like protein
MDQGHYELAVECYDRGLAQKPHEVDVRVDLGACMHFLGKNQEAIDNFKKALEDNPRHQVAKLNLGVAYMSMGDSAQAGSWWRQLLSENPPEELKTRAETFLKQLSQP